MAWSDDEDDFNPPPYDPFGLLPQDGEGAEGAPAPRSGHRFVSDTHWRAARDAYLDGESAASISARFGMAERTIRARAQEQGWRRADQVEVIGPRVEYAVEDGRDALIDDTLDEVPLDVLVDRALLCVRRAIAADRAVEAGRWIRTHRLLSEMAEAQRRAESAAQVAAAEAARAVEPERFTSVWAAKDAERRILKQREADAYVASSVVLNEALSARLGPPDLHGLHGADEIFSGDP